MKNKSIKRSLLSFMLCFCLITTLFVFSPPTEVYAGSATIQQYFKFNYNKIDSQGNVSVNYTILKDITPALSNAFQSKIVASWPYAYRNSLPAKSVSILNTKAGTYTANLGNINSYNAVGWMNIKIQIMVGQFFEYIECGQVFYRPNSDITTEYHEVTTAEAVGSFVLRTAPGITITFSPSTTLVKVVGAATTLLGISSDLMATLNISNSCPTISVGNYLMISTWYTADGELKGRVKVWKDKSRYTRGDLPMYDGTYCAFVFPK